jgi:hypothetical protein
MTRLRSSLRRAGTTWLLAGAAPLPSAPQLSAQAGPVPAEYQGTWVPARATCESPARVVITADQLTLMNATDKQAIGGIEMAGPAYWGPDYHGIEAVLITEFDGQQPVTATFNAAEKKGVAQMGFAPVQPGAPSNPQLAAYNKRITQLNLAKRFPLDNVPLKKCTGQPAATGPSICAGTPHCTEVKPFAATVTDFRTSSAGSTRVVTLNLRFQNRTDAPLVLGYVESLPADQYQLGKEYLLRLDGFTAGTPDAAGAGGAGATATASASGEGAAAAPSRATDSTVAAAVNATAGAVKAVGKLFKK